MAVGRICTREVDVAAPDESAQVAAQRMKKRNVGSLVVLDQHQRPAGVITDRDLVLRVLATGLEPGTTSLSEVMTKLPDSVLETTPIESAI
ncbi:MAG: CBS domain-containing protein, partial [Planctomycetota bacterium]